ncbi:hypothetical protein [uncultured Ruminococcus sp.]|uniref:hypothetical protein n=1 Tax=uncultured Ruminococcus sp. TaxID=165186 RepID=UPI0026665BD8|nr:hypothetical protein [uncultured Ruminococcus sp.]
MDAALVTQIIHILYDSRLIEGRDFSYSSVYINDVQIYFDDFEIYDDFLCLDFNGYQIVSIHLNDIDKIC